LAYQFHPQGEGDFHGREEVRDLITQIEGHKIRVRAIEAEIEAIKREEWQKSSRTTEEQPPMAHF